MKRFSPIFERTLAGSALLCTFVVVASIAQPRMSSASQSSNAQRSTIPAALAEDNILQNKPIVIEETSTRQLRNLGDLSGSSYVVRIYMYGDFPLFSVFNHDGSVVAQMLREIELKQLVDDPDLHANIARVIDENTTTLNVEKTIDLPGE